MKNMRNNPISWLTYSGIVFGSKAFVTKAFKGQGGITIYNALLFFTILIFGIVYLSAMVGVSILQTSGNPSNITIPSNFLDPFQTIGFFLALASTNSTYTVLSVFLFAPFAVMMVYAILQLIRGTG
jgi:hypothetical protein